MRKKVLVIGGTRFFGRRLVRRLADAGHQVTILTRGNAPDEFGLLVDRIRADRSNEDALRRALVLRDFDLVYDQMCYNPIDARSACDIFAGRVGHYVMASTIEAYDFLHGIVDHYREDDIVLQRLAIDFDYPWHLGASDANYGAGKRQAEAVVAGSSMRWTTVRIAHVLSGPDDFTGRLRAYVRHALARDPLRPSTPPRASTFTTVEQITDFLSWVGEEEAEGVFNAGSPDELSAVELHQIVYSALGTTPVVERAPAPDPELPFNYRATHSMNIGKALSRGYRFASIIDRIPEMVLAHAAAIGQ